MGLCKKTGGSGSLRIRVPCAARRPHRPSTDRRSRDIPTWPASLVTTPDATGRRTSPKPLHPTLSGSVGPPENRRCTFSSRVPNKQLPPVRQLVLISLLLELAAPAGAQLLTSAAVCAVEVIQIPVAREEP
ncbi:hypothetical protein BGZ60DRAFT_68192 [Tricladium varicosporioides]|nr:hypothetical protein BGZ60DRAFT_68192 [Hymenoscyphus varicosporioides]